MLDEFNRSFKDDVADDCDIFVDVTEFGRLTWVDGVLLWAQVIEKTAEQSGRQNETYPGLHGDYTTIYFETAVYCRKRERIPRNGEWFYINGKRFTVVSARDEQGITKIVASAYRQNTLRKNPFGEDDPYGQLV